MGDGATVSVVVPTYKEAANLEQLVARLASALVDRIARFEILIVDDDSRDGSDAIIERLRGEGHPVRLIVRKGERSLSSAVLHGFAEAKGQILVCMDADLSHPPEAIPEMIERLVHGQADFVIGSRYARGGTTDAGWGVLRWLNSKIATALARPFTTVSDPMSGFFALSRDAFARGGDLSPVGYKIGLELLVKCRCERVAEVPIHFADRRLGESKLNVREQLNYLRHIKRLFDYKYGAASRFVQFCLVGGSGVVVDLTCFALLLRAGVNLGGARAIAIMIAMTFNFWFNRRLTFSYGRSGNIVRQYAQFVLTCAFGATLNWSVSVSLALALDFFRAHAFLAALIGILAGTASNFMLASNWVFRHGKPTWRGTARRRAKGHRQLP